MTLIHDDEWPTAPPEPLAYMSTANYRGLRSPWSLLVVVGMALRRLRWLRAVGFSTTRPPVRAVASRWGRIVR